MKDIDLLLCSASLFILVCTIGCVPRPHIENITTSTSTTRSHRTFSINRSGGWSNGVVRPGIGFRNQTSGGSFVFPTDEPPVREPDRPKSTSRPARPTRAPHYKKPGACRDGSKFCNDTSDYPSGLVEELLENSNTQYRALFISDIINDEDDILRQRAGDGNQLETPLCESEVEIVFPKKAEDKDGNLKYVINHGEYKQGIRVEKCSSLRGGDNGEEEQTCDIPGSLPDGYKAICKQKYIYRKLIALSDDGSSMEPREFPIPSCCSCVTRQYISRRRSSTQRP